MDKLVLARVGTIPISARKGHGSAPNSLRVHNYIEEGNMYSSPTTILRARSSEPRREAKLLAELELPKGTKTKP
jgi:hypothetical protein